MKMRRKGNWFMGEVTGMVGTVDKPLVELTMKNGDKLQVEENELSSNSVQEEIQEFIFSVFKDHGSLKNRLIYFGSIVGLGFIIGLILH